MDKLISFIDFVDNHIMGNKETPEACRAWRIKANRFEAITVGIIVTYFAVQFLKGVF